jgi:hypothetical protein
VYLFKDPSLTPWTNSSIVGVPNYPVHGPYKKPTAVCDISLNEFSNSLSNMNLSFKFDYALGVMKY